MEEVKTNIEITGTYIRTIIKDFENGYTQFSFLCKNFEEYKDKGKLICEGYLPVITNGVPLKLTGHFKERNQKYYFAIQNAELYSDKEQNTLDYLLSTRFKGIGPKTAQKIIAITGVNIFEFVKRSDAKEKLSTITELKGEKVDKFINVITETFFEKEVYEFILEFGGTYWESQSIFQQYGNESINKLNANPYEVGRNTELPFIVCDAIAKKQNMQPYNESRLRYLIMSAMYQIAGNGNTSATISEIHRKTTDIAKQSAFPEYYPPSSLILCTILQMQNIYKDFDKNKTPIYTLKEFAIAEDVICDNLYRFHNAKNNYNIDVETEINNSETHFDIEYSESQKKSFNFLNTSGIKILTGGPGTGKTTVINGLIDVYKRIHPQAEIALCAPTGRAAQKIKETTGHPAATVHRLLNIKPYESFDEINYDVDELNVDLLIVDEFSMVDLKLFAYITNAIKEKATVILCGDIFQLPSVGAGNVLYDLIDTKLFDVVNLDIIYRQKENSKIISLAQNIKDGIIEQFTNNPQNANMKFGEDVYQVTKYYSDKEIQLIKTNSAKQIHDIIVNTLKNTFLNKKSIHYVEDILDLQILSSTKKEDAGTISLNKSIHYIYNQNADAHTFFAIGDKIMMMENNYEIGYCNGDIGFITNIDNTNNTISININDIEMHIPHSHIKDISLSYACTIHKSQGSEYSYVIVSLPKSPTSILQRNLIYTAITRAKKYVAIIFEDDALFVAVNRSNVNKRRTNLSKKIKKIFKEI